MATTMEDIHAWLDAEEVDYANAKKVGPQVVPLLMELVKGDDLALATKATYFASLIDDEQAAIVLEAAAERTEPIMRLAAAAGIRNLTEGRAEKIIDRLSGDADSGVRKVALNSGARFKSPRLAAKFGEMAKTDPVQFVRDAAARTVKQMSESR